MTASREPEGGPSPIGALVDLLSARAFGVEVGAAVERGGATPFAGSAGSLSSLVAADLARRALATPAVLVVAHLDEADDAVEELRGAGVVL